MKGETNPPTLPIPLPANTPDTLTRTSVASETKQDTNGLIDRLPPEITSEIFLQCIPPFRPYKRQYSDISFPFAFGEVCTAWREIAEATPELWTSMTFDMHFKSDQDVSNYLPHINESLRRSGSLPVSIRILGQRSSYRWKKETFKQVMDCIVQYSNRWRDIDLRLTTSCYQYLPSKTQVLPYLQSLLLKRSQSSGVENEWNLNLAETAPRLEDLTLVRIYLSRVHVNWGLLTRIEIRQFYTDECCKVLSLATNLVHCIIRSSVAGQDGHGIPSHPIISPHLQTLDWYFDHIGPMEVVLRKLVAPVLSHLRIIAGHVGFSAHSYRAVQSFLERTASSLSTLIVGDYEPLDESFLLEIWASSPILTVINLIRIPAMEHLRKGRPPLTPELPSHYTHPTAGRWDEVYYLLPALQGF